MTTQDAERDFRAGSYSVDSPDQAAGLSLDELVDNCRAALYRRVFSPIAEALLGEGIHRLSRFADLAPHPVIPALAEGFGPLQLADHLEVALDADPGRIDEVLDGSRDLIDAVRADPLIGIRSNRAPSGSMIVIDGLDGDRAGALQIYLESVGVTYSIRHGSRR